MSEDSPLGTFEEQVLLAVIRNREAAYGMGVRREIEEVTGREVAVGAVYTTLDRLEAKDLVRSERAQGAGARRTFKVTPDGLRALAASRAMRQRLWDGIDLASILARGTG